MKPLNTYPIEDFLEKAKILIKSNQKNLTLSQKEVSDLASSISAVMARLVGNMDSQPKAPESISIKMDGGRF